MALIEVEVEAVGSGPMFDGRASRAVTAFLANATAEVAYQGLADVHHAMDRAFRNPTPYYETQVTVQRVQNDMVVHDRGISYGPWLEGVSSRNQTSRFKGYHHWRRTANRLRDKAPGIAQQVLARHLPDMGGGGA